MLIANQEYARGVVRWSLDRPASIFAVSSTPDGSVQVSEAMDVSSGMVIPAERPGVMSFRVRPEDGDLDGVSGTLTHDREINGEIVAFVFDVGGGGISSLPPLIGIPGRGEFERLVAATPMIRLPEGRTVIRLGDVAIRLLSRTTLMRNEVELEAPASVASIQAIGRPKETVVSGPLLEIVAPMNLHGLPEAAKALYGLAMLELTSWGKPEIMAIDSIKSRLVGAEHGVTLWPQPPILGPANRQMGVPTAVREEQLRMLDCHLACILESEAVARKFFVPLRWYLRARESGTDLDEFTSGFVGLEGLVSAHSRERATESRIQGLATDLRVTELLGQLRGEYPDDHVDQLISRLAHVGPSLLDHVEAVADSLDLGPTAAAEFRRARSERGAVLHGNRDQITPQWARWATETLGNAIKAVLSDSCISN